MADRYNSFEAILNTKGEEEYLTRLKKGLVPAFIDTNDVETNILGLAVKYPKAVVSLGNELTPQVTQETPTVSWLCSKPDTYYTFLMTDPNSRKPETHHWLVVNILGNDFSSGECLTVYRGPEPPKGTGIHHYSFLLFEQSGGKINFSEPHIPFEERELRRGFSTRNFVKKHNLGKVIAGNYYLAQNNDDD